MFQLELQEQAFVPASYLLCGESNVNNDVSSDMTPEQQELVIQYMELAERIAFQAWNKARHALDIEDLKSASFLGLCMAAKRWEGYCRDRNYDPTRMEYFATFVKRRANGAILDYLRTIDWASRSDRHKARQLQRAGQDQGATIAEMSLRTEMTESSIRETILKMTRRPVSLEAEEIDKADVKDVESSASGAALLAVVVATIRELEPECRVVLSLHYFASKELKEVAKLMGITESRASNLHTKSVVAVREALMDSVQGYQQMD